MGLFKDKHTEAAQSHHAGLRGEDDDLVKRSELLEQVLDARTLLKPPTGGQLETGGERDVRAGRSHGSVDRETDCPSVCSQIRKPTFQRRFSSAHFGGK